MEDDSVEYVSQASALADFPFSAILSSPNTKRANNNFSNVKSNTNSLVIHVRNAHSLLRVQKGDFLKRLRDTILESKTDTLMLFTTDQFCDIRSHSPRSYQPYRCGYGDIFEYDLGDPFENEFPDLIDPLASMRRKGKHTKHSQPLESSFLSVSGKNPRTEAILLAPIQNRAQRILLDTHQKLFYEHRNIRLLQRLIRRTFASHRNSPLVQPFAKWDFLQGLEIQTQKLFTKTEICVRDLNDLVRAISRDLQEERIRESILRMCRRKDALNDWCSDREEEEEEQLSKWASFPVKAQKSIEEIERNKGKFRFEQHFLSLLINPDEVEEGWSDIALDPDVKQAIVQLVHQPSNMGTPTYGILKRGRVGGALLYGPPGTGKTHLARVLARESKAITICVSAADIRNKYVGETEKAIQGLFNLGQMLCPCVIFIDEADDLFRPRRPDDHSWERSQINQLLSEMDGLKKSKSPPFVLLATNFPNELDYAVLRRVASRIHIGLPSAEHRLQIFQICLKDELLDGDVNLLQLVKKSKGYSGSDIQTACVQAALACDTFVNNEGKRRLLKHMHFEKAFQRTAPTVSKKALAEIKAFAKEFDAAALEKMAQEEMEGGAAFATSQGSNNTVVADSVSNTNYNFQAQPLAARAPPVLNDLDLGSLRPYFTSHEPSNFTKGRVEEMDSDIEGPELSDMEGPFQYTPMKPNSKEIRVLSFHTSAASSGVDDTTTLRCTLRTVDLDDWTIAYRAIASMSAAEGLPSSPNYRLAQWHFTSAYRDRLRKGECEPGPLQEDLLAPIWSRLRFNNDAPFEGIFGIDPRYNWGDFIALSYVWGDPNERRDILLNGYRFSVTSNLYEALINLRDSFEVGQMKLFVWIDAICINQSDLAERAAEVKKMGMIYSECLSVRAWLGQPGLEVVAELPSAREFLDTVSELHLRDMVLDKKWETIADIDTAYSLLVVHSGLSSSAYWKRLWTIQEVALAPSLLFCYGQHSFATEEILKFGFLVSMGLMGKKFNDHSSNSFAEMVVNTSQVFLRLHQLRPENTITSIDVENQPLDFVDLVRLARTSKATDQRDKVYGLLALLPDAVAKRIHPDYDPSFSVQDAFITLSKSYFQAEGNLDFLARIQKRPSFLQHIPSWVVDLEAEHHFSNVTLTAKRHRRHGANLGMSMKELGFSEDNRLLYCEGVIVDSIGCLGAIRMWSPELEAMLGIDMEVGIRSSSLCPHHDWKLSLARVLMQDSHFVFSGVPSILDIPWVEQDEVDGERNFTVFPRDVGYYHFSEDDKHWPRLYQITPLNRLFHNSLYGNETFDIGRKPLRSYFTASMEQPCSDPKLIMELAHEVFAGFGGNRLFTSRNGLLGSAPAYAKLGDKIAILTNCDMPMVLRPRGAHYELIGSCFVEGLMKGETSRQAKKGEYHIETLSLC